MSTLNLGPHNDVRPDDGTARRDWARCARFREDDLGDHRRGKETDDGVAAVGGEGQGSPRGTDKGNDGTRAGFGRLQPIYRFHFGWSAVARASHFNLTFRRQETPGTDDADIRHGPARDSDEAANTKDADERCAKAIEHN